MRVRMNEGGAIDYGGNVHGGVHYLFLPKTRRNRKNRVAGGRSGGNWTCRSGEPPWQTYLSSPLFRGLPLPLLFTPVKSPPSEFHDIVAQSSQPCLLQYTVCSRRRSEGKG